LERAPVSGSGSSRFLVGRVRALTTRPFGGTARAFLLGGEAFFAGAGDAFFPLGGLVVTAGRGSLGSAARLAVGRAAPSFFEAAGLFGMSFFLSGLWEPRPRERPGDRASNT
jgi:hypothetical protein